MQPLEHRLVEETLQCAIHDLVTLVGEGLALVRMLNRNHGAQFQECQFTTIVGNHGQVLLFSNDGCFGLSIVMGLGSTGQALCQQYVHVFRLRDSSALHGHDSWRVAGIPLQHCFLRSR